jgi:hypothetical protein
MSQAPQVLALGSRWGIRDTMFGRKCDQLLVPISESSLSEWLFEFFDHTGLPLAERRHEDGWSE